MADYIYEWPRQLTESDKTGLLALYDEVARHEGTLGFYGSLQGETGRRLVDSYAAALAGGGIHVLIVRDRNGEVGTLTLEQPSLHARRHIVDLKRCVVARRSRGKFLLEGWAQAKRRARELGGRVLTLEVRADGPVDLWKSLGFQEYGYLPDYARRDGRSIPGHYLYYEITDLDEEQSG